MLYDVEGETCFLFASVSQLSQVVLIALWFSVLCCCYICHLCIFVDDPIGDPPPFEVNHLCATAGELYCMSSNQLLHFQSFP